MFSFTHLPYGISSALSSFHKIVKQLFGSMQEIACLLYDSLIVFDEIIHILSWDKVLVHYTVGASSYGVSAILSDIYENNLAKPKGYASKISSAAKRLLWETVLLRKSLTTNIFGHCQ